MTSALLDKKGDLKQEVLDDPYTYYAALRGAGRAVYEEALSGWVIGKYAHVEAAVRSPTLTAARTNAYFSSLPEAERGAYQHFAEVRGDMLLFCDGAKHQRIRRVVEPLIQREVATLGGSIDSIVDALLDQVDDRSEFDVIEALAAPLPLRVLLRMFGFPTEDSEAIRQWALRFNRAIGGVVRSELVAAAQVALEELESYIGEQITTGGTARSALLSGLLCCVGAQITRSEMVATCLMLVSAGHETTTNLIANSILALLQHPDERRWLAKNPQEVPSALEELIRYDAPVQLTTRATTQECVVAEQPLEEGERVVLLWGAANRDPEVFSRPDVLELRRRPNRHLSFGLGTHRCPGASLARLQGRAAISGVLKRYYEMEAAKPGVRRRNFSFRGLEQLYVGVRHH